jgi:hypothetical protein
VSVEEEIRQVLYRYCRGVDRIDMDLVRECYHPDAVDDHGAFKGGVEPFLAWISRLLPRYGVTTHSLSNILIERHPNRDDVVRAESYGVAEHQTPGGPPELNLTIAFRYLDRFEDRGDGWRIADRLCTTEWVRVNDPAGIFPIDDRFLRGARGDRSDPVYRAWD